MFTKDVKSISRCGLCYTFCVSQKASFHAVYKIVVSLLFISLASSTLQCKQYCFDIVLEFDKMFPHRAYIISLYIILFTSFTSSTLQCRQYCFDTVFSLLSLYLIFFTSLTLSTFQCRQYCVDIVFALLSFYLICFHR